jgi:hypothetical protein
MVPVTVFKGQIKQKAPLRGIAEGEPSAPKQAETVARAGA